MRRGRESTGRRFRSFVLRLLLRLRLASCLLLHASLFIVSFAFCAGVSRGVDAAICIALHLHGVDREIRYDMIRYPRATRTTE